MGRTVVCPFHYRYQGCFVSAVLDLKREVVFDWIHLLIGSYCMKRKVKEYPRK